MIVLHYINVGYVGYDVPAEEGAGGYGFYPSPSRAVDFKTQNAAADFCETGPEWARDLTRKGLLTIKDKV